VRVAAARLITGERLEGLGETTPFIDVLQQVFDAHARQASICVHKLTMPRTSIGRD